MRTGFTSPSSGNQHQNEGGRGLSQSCARDVRALTLPHAPSARTTRTRWPLLFAVALGCTMPSPRDSDAPVSSDEDLCAFMASMGYVDGSCGDDDATGRPVGVLLNSAACDVPRLIVSGQSIRVVTPGGTELQRIDTPWNLRSATPLDDGGYLVVRYGYGGLVRLDATGEVVWERAGLFHHHAALDGETVWTLFRSGAPVQWNPILHSRPTEQVVRLDLATGDTMAMWDIDDLVPPGLPDGPRKDPWHPNRVQPLPGGGLLLSLREANAVLTVWPGTERAPKVWEGPWTAQHAPSVVEGGGLLVFDNGGRRVIETNTDGQVVWSHPVKSHAWGYAERTPCGTTLVADTVARRVLEVTDDHRIVWDYRTEGPVMEASTRRQ